MKYLSLAKGLAGLMSSGSSANYLITHYDSHRAIFVGGGEKCLVLWGEWALNVGFCGMGDLFFSGLGVLWRRGAILIAPSCFLSGKVRAVSGQYDALRESSDAALLFIFQGITS